MAERWGAPSFNRRAIYAETIEGTSTTTVSIVSGSPSSCRAFSTSRISSATRFGVSCGDTSLPSMASKTRIFTNSSRSSVSKTNRIASLMFSSADWRSSPWLTHPGKAGQRTEYPPPTSGSSMIVNFLAESDMRSPVLPTLCASGLLTPPPTWPPKRSGGHSLVSRLAAGVGLEPKTFGL